MGRHEKADPFQAIVATNMAASFMDDSRVAEALVWSNLAVANRLHEIGSVLEEVVERLRYLPDNLADKL